MMKVRVENHYDHGLEEVYAAFREPDFYVAKFEGIGDREIEIIESGEDDDGFWIEFERMVPADAPGMLKKLIGDWNQMGQTENWSADGDGYRNDLELHTHGVPLNIDGTMLLTGDDESCVNRIEMRLSSSVPLLGGHLEKFAATRTKKGLDDEYDFIRAFLED